MTKPTNSNPTFYEAIADHYDELFPLAAAKAAFCRQYLAEPPQRILDIGCATGSLCFDLAGDGHRITGLDADERMIRLAKKKGTGANAIEFICGDMRELNRHIPPGSVNGAFCFGNTMAHLDGTPETAQFLAQVRDILKPGGVLLGQLVNYEKILTHNITTLPLIDRDHAVFKRSYTVEGDRRSILFTGELTLKADGRTLGSSVKLQALTMGNLKELLPAAGFKEIKFYGDFNRAPYTTNAGALVFSARA